MLLGGVTALLPVFARDVFAAGPWALGLLRAAPAVGALTMALVLTRWPIERNAGKMMFAAVAGFGLSTVVFALSTNFVVALAALAVLGASDMVSVVIRMTLVQLGTPDEVRGRVTAVNGLFIGASNQLGEFRAGAMASLDRRGAGRAGRRHRHAGDRADLDAAVSRSSGAPTGWRARRPNYSAAASCCCGLPIASQ